MGHTRSTSPRLLRPNLKLGDDDSRDSDVLDLALHRMVGKLLRHPALRAEHVHVTFDAFGAIAVLDAVC